MDAPLTLTRLIAELNDLLEARDFEGGEELLSAAFGSALPAPFLHFQMGRMYTRWNKMSSAIEHLSKAAELACASADEMLLVQALEELRQARRLQAEQVP